MIIIHTRQNRKGNWWCNSTIKGYDVSFEGESVESAQDQMWAYLKKHQIYNTSWLPVEFYPHNEQLKIDIDYIMPAKSRIDNNPHG